MKFRTVVVVEAVQLRWDTWDEVCRHAGVGHLREGKPEGCLIAPDGIVHRNQDGPADDGWVLGLLIPTTDGRLLVGHENDWIIRGERELYPCKPDVFAATYEPVEHTEPRSEPDDE